MREGVKNQESVDTGLRRRRYCAKPWPRDRAYRCFPTRPGTLLTHHGRIRLAAEAFWNSGMLRTTPFTRYLPVECSLACAIMRANSGRVALAPYLAKPRKKRWSGVKPSLGFSGIGQHIEQRHVRDAQAAVVGGVLAQRELAINVYVVNRDKAVIFLDQAAFAACRTASRSFAVHQSCRLPWASNWLPSSSKPCVSSWPMTAPMRAES